MGFQIVTQLKKRIHSVQIVPMKHCAEYSGEKTR